VRVAPGGIDLLAWLNDIKSLDHFEPWFRTLAFNSSSAAARSLPVFRRFMPRQDPGSPIDALLHEIADYRSNESGDRWGKMLKALARYPMDTRAVLLLRAHRHTWDEVAAILRISVEAARWAVEAYRDELRRDFDCFR
jgi:DNA-directed RNA polymerase specialized sigma24 family protein